MIKKATRKRTKKVTAEQKVKAAADVVVNNLIDAGFAPPVQLGVLLHGIIAIGMKKGKSVAIHHLGGLASRNPKVHYTVWKEHMLNNAGVCNCQLITAIAKTVQQKPLRWALTLSLIGAVLDTMN